MSLLHKALSASLVVSSVLLVSCGGGGGGSSDNAPQPIPNPAPPSPPPPSPPPPSPPPPSPPPPAPPAPPAGPQETFPTATSYRSLETGYDPSMPNRYTLRVGLQAFDTNARESVDVVDLLTPSHNLNASGGGLLGTQKYRVSSIRCNAPSSAGDAYKALMLFDRSGSMASNDPSDESRAAGRAFVTRFGAADQGLIADFPDQNGSARFLNSGFTGNTSELQQAMDSLKSPDGNTPLWDSMLLSLQRFQSGSSTRQALLAFSDGEDTASRGSSGQVTQSALALGAAVYAINLKNTNAAELNNVALATGGSIYTTDDAQKLIRYYQVLGLLLSGRAKECVTDVEVTFEPVSGAGEVGYGPASSTTPKFSLEVRGQTQSSVSELIATLPLYPGRKIGTTTASKTVFETDISETDTNPCITVQQGFISNGCSTTIYVSACDGDGVTCDAGALAPGQGRAVPGAGSGTTYVSCLYRGNLERFIPSVGTGSTPAISYRRWRDPSLRYACVSEFRY